MVIVEKGNEEKGNKEMFSDITKRVIDHFDALVPAYPAHIIEYCQGLVMKEGISYEADLQRFATSRGVELSSAECKELFNVIDTDGDGRIELNELVAWVGNDDWHCYDKNPKGSLLKSQVRSESMKALFASPFPFAEENQASRSHVHEVTLRSEGAPVPGTGGTRIKVDVVPFTVAALKEEAKAEERSLEQLSDGGENGGDDDSDTEEKQVGADDPMNLFTAQLPLRAKPSDKELGDFKKALKEFYAMASQEKLTRKMGKLYVGMKVTNSGSTPSLTLYGRNSKCDPFLGKFFHVWARELNKMGEDELDTLFKTPEKFFRSVSFSVEFEKSLSEVLKDDTSAILSLIDKYYYSASVSLPAEFPVGGISYLTQRILSHDFDAGYESDKKKLLEHLTIASLYGMFKNNRLEVFGRDPTLCFFEIIAALADSVRERSGKEMCQDMDPGKGSLLNELLHSDLLEEGLRQRLQKFFPCETTAKFGKPLLYKPLIQMLDKETDDPFGAKDALRSLSQFASKFLGFPEKIELSTSFYKLTVRTAGLDVFQLLPRDDQHMSELWTAYVDAKKKPGPGGSDDDSDKGSEASDEKESEEKPSPQDLIRSELNMNLFERGFDPKRYPFVRNLRYISLNQFNAYYRVAVLGQLSAKALANQVFRVIAEKPIDRASASERLEENEPGKVDFAWCRARPYCVMDVSACDYTAETVSQLRAALSSTDVLVVVTDSSQENTETAAIDALQLTLSSTDEKEEGEAETPKVNPQLQILVVEASSGPQELRIPVPKVWPFPTIPTKLKVDVTDLASCRAIMGQIAALPSRRDPKRSGMWDSASHDI